VTDEDREAIERIQGLRWSGFYKDNHEEWLGKALRCP
jgi:hypothetical protein